MPPSLIDEDVKVMEFYKNSSRDQIAQACKNDPGLGMRYQAALARLHERKRVEHAPINAEILQRFARYGMVADDLYKIRVDECLTSEALAAILIEAGVSHPPSIRKGVISLLRHSFLGNIAWRPLLAHYRTEPNLSRIAPPNDVGSPSGPKDAMADALSTMAKPENLEETIGLLVDTTNGPSRIFFVRNLVHWKSQKAIDTLKRLSCDPELQEEIEFRLKGNLKRQQDTGSSRKTMQ